jgi:hypothetical protein
LLTSLETTVLDNRKETTMAVKAASRLVTRVMRVAFKETFSPANQAGRASSAGRSLNEAGNVSRTFSSELHQHIHAYTGSADPFATPNNTADSWRHQLCRPGRELEAANSAGDVLERRGRR